MKIHKKNNYILYILVLLIFISSACQKSIGDFFNEQFPETSNSSNQMIIDGQVAVPILNTSFQLANFIPNSKDSSLWIELDANKFIHFRMYFKDIFAISPSDISLIYLPTLPKDSLTFKTDSSSLNLFSKMLDGHLFFNEPKITLIFHNQLPVKLFVRIDSLNFNSFLGTYRMGQTTKHYIAKGGDNGSYTTDTEIILDKTSEGFSNFPNMFTPIPKNINFVITAGNDKDTTYNGSGNERLKMDFDFDLPSDLRIDSLVMIDTFPLTIDSASSPITGLTLKIFFDNEFPFSGKTQIQFADTNSTGEANNIVLELFDNDGWEFGSSVTNASGETISSTKSNVTITLTDAQLKTLTESHVSRLILKSTLNSYNTSSSQFVKLFTFYKLGIKIGAKVDYSVNVLQ